MTRTRRIAVLTTATLSVVTIGACHKKPAPQPEPVAAPVGPNADSARRAQEEAARRAAEEAAARHRADSISAAEAAARDAASAQAAMRATLTTAVHFDLDKSELRPEDQTILAAKVPILQANTDVAIRI